MAIEDDVLVIGGGLAGITAALSAAERDADVRLVSYKQSTLRHATGLIDVLGYAPAGSSTGRASAESGGPLETAGAASSLEGPLVDPFAALSDLPAGHPYERVGVEAVREALLFFDAVAGDAYEGAHTDANALVPTTGGTVKPTARYPASVAAGLASDRRSALLVGFEALPDFDAPMAAAHLRAAGVPFEPRGTTVRFPGNLRDDATITRYARLLDRDEGVGAGAVPARTALAETVRPHLEGEPRVGFPAVLGDEYPDVVRRDLAERLGVDVFEVPTGPPSLPGIRLEDLLFDALDDAGVRVTTGVPVVGYEADGGESGGDGSVAGGGSEAGGSSVAGADGSVAGGSDGGRRPNEGGDGGRRPNGGGPGARIDRVLVDRTGNEVPYRADQYVLATGGLVGKGVRSERDADGPDRVFEPIFDCHVAHSADRDDWFDEAAFGDHPFARFGVTVDRELRPLDRRGAVEFSNLRAAGAVLSGYDYAAEKSGAGVSLATGYAAGRRAGEGVAR